jgi:archaellum biogenesis ATPase FlaH
MAERIGVEKCQEVKYPEGVKDANEYLKKNTREDFRELIRIATPFYRYQFKGVGDIISSIREKKDNIVKTDYLPKVEMEKDWLVIVSGKTNTGKTSYVLNIADDLTNKKLPVLIFPFERGIETVGKRFLQVKFDKTMQDFGFMQDDEWEKTIEKCIDLPVYFAMPKKDAIIETIIKAKRIFDIKVVIIDHLDYIIRHSNGNKENEISDTLQNLKRVAEENGIIMLVVTHVRKVENPGSMLKRKATMEDLKGSSSLYQDPEVVAMLDNEEDGNLSVSVVKNKGEMKGRKFKFNATTGKVYTTLLDDYDIL